MELHGGAALGRLEPGSGEGGSAAGNKGGAVVLLRGATAAGSCGLPRQGCRGGVAAFSWLGKRGEGEERLPAASRRWSTAGEPWCSTRQGAWIWLGWAAHWNKARAALPWLRQGF